MSCGISSFVINPLGIGQFLFLWTKLLCINKCSSTLARVYNSLIVHVGLINPVIGVSAIDLPEDMLAHLIEGHFVAAFLLSHHGLELVVHLNVSKH